PACALDTHEIDEAALWNGAHEPDAHAIADVEPFLTALDATLHGRVEDPNPRALGRGARHHAVELLADPVAEGTCGRGLSHHPLDLLGTVLLQRALRGERAELVVAVRDLLAGERCADEALRDEIGIASVRGGRVRVLAHGEPEVSDHGLPGEARH